MNLDHLHRCTAITDWCWYVPSANNDKSLFQFTPQRSNKWNRVTLLNVFNLWNFYLQQIENNSKGWNFEKFETFLKFWKIFYNWRPMLVYYLNGCIFDIFNAFSLMVILELHSLRFHGTKLCFFFLRNEALQSTLMQDKLPNSIHPQCNLKSYRKKSIRNKNMKNMRHIR